MEDDKYSILAFLFIVLIIMLHAGCEDIERTKRERNEQEHVQTMKWLELQIKSTQTSGVN